MTMKGSNLKLLLELLQINSPSFQEEEVIEVVVRELQALGFQHDIDDSGNISAIRGQAKSYPLLNAHMDIVDLIGYSYAYSGYGGSGKSYNSTEMTYDTTTGVYGYKSYYEDDWYDSYQLDDDVDYLIETLGMDIIKEVLSCRDCQLNESCWSDDSDGELCNHLLATEDGKRKIVEWANKYNLLDNNEIIVQSEDDSRYFVSEKDGIIKGKGAYRVLGGDDKCGIFIALEVARRTNTPMKLLFTVAEEVGCVGIDKFIKHSPEWFSDVKYSITIDRKGGDNLLMSQLGISSCTRGFGANVAMEGIMAGIPIKVMDGSISDVVAIRELVMDSINISAGYYSPHTEDEYIKWDEVKRIVKWVRRIVTNTRI